MWIDEALGCPFSRNFSKPAPTTIFYLTTTHVMKNLKIADAKFNPTGQKA